MANQPCTSRGSWAASTARDLHAHGILGRGRQIALHSGGGVYRFLKWSCYLFNSFLRLFHEYEGTSHFQVAASSAKIGFGSQSETFFEGEVP